jgi:hypothetical protein
MRTAFTAQVQFNMPSFSNSIAAPPPDFQRKPGADSPTSPGVPAPGF